MTLSRITTALSVRLRLIVLALVPVFGFAAIGLAYMSSERTVEAAFGSVQESVRLADASRSFKESLTATQMSAREFVANTQAGIAQSFAESPQTGVDRSKTIHS